MTGLGGGRRVPKDASRVAAYGTVDELNSAIGVALALGLWERLARELATIQNELFDLGSDLCWPADDARGPDPDGRDPACREAGTADRRVNGGRRATHELPAAGGTPVRRNSTWRGRSAGEPSARPSRLAHEEPIGEFVLA